MKRIALISATFGTPYLLKYFNCYGVPIIPNLSHVFDTPTGISVSRGAAKENDVNGIRVVLVRDSTRKEGYRILTGYPE